MYKGDGTRHGQTGRGYEAWGVWPSGVKLHGLWLDAASVQEVLISA